MFEPKEVCLAKQKETTNCVVLADENGGTTVQALYLPKALFPEGIPEKGLEIVIRERTTA